MTDKFNLESTGDPSYAALEGNIQRALARVQQRTGALGTQTSYSAANAVDWSGTPPATLAEALDRIAAALGPIA